MTGLSCALGSGGRWPAIVVLTAGALPVLSVDPQLSDSNVVPRAASDEAQGGVATFERTNPPVGGDDVSYLAVARRESPERTREGGAHTSTSSTTTTTAS